MGMREDVREIQTRGVRDDGTPHGILSAEIARGNVVAVPFDAAEVTVSSNQSVYGKNVVVQELVNGKGVKVSLAHSATLANQFAYKGHFNGNVFGLLCEISTGTAMPGIMIDGVAYELEKFPRVDPIGRDSSVLRPRIPGKVIATDLGPGPHYYEITLPGHLTEDRSWILYGMLLDSREGYRAPGRGGMIGSTKTLTSGYTNVTNDTVSNNATGGAGIRKIQFYNPTGSAVTAILSTTSAAGGNFWGVSVPAGSTMEWDPGLVVYQNSYLYATGNGLLATMIEGF